MFVFRLADNCYPPPAIQDITNLLINNKHHVTAITLNSELQLI